MDKRKILRVIQNTATDSEVNEVFEWVRANKKNETYFAQLKSYYTVASMPQDTADTAAYFSFMAKLKAKNTQVKKRIRIAYFSTAAAVFTALLFNIFLKQEPKTDNPAVLNNSYSEPAIRTMYTEKGVKGTIMLPDSSVVALNSDSRITYPDMFTGSTREVQLSGEGYFEVLKNPDMPMVVTTNKGIKIEVLGTTFLVKSYDNDAESKTSLYSGEINLISTDARTSKPLVTKIRPNETAITTDATLNKIIRVKTEEKQKKKELAWTRGELIFDETPMPEVIKMLERWHGTTFIITNSSFLNYNLSASFKSESIVQIMYIISICTSTEYEINENVVTIY